MCGVNRNQGELGACKSSSSIKAARAELHFWEEPIISGSRGSGAIFFSGCSLSCVFCQNREISVGLFGKEISVERLVEIMFKLKEKGAHNINLVTPTHFAPSIKDALFIAKAKGLDLPIIYNTSSYDTVDTIKSYEGLVDVYLPDYKYFSERTAGKYSKASDYPKKALSTIDEMVRQAPKPVISDGLIKSGVVIRLLQLPRHLGEAKLSLSRLYSRFGDNVYFSLMSQYTPIGELPPPLNRRVTKVEYRSFVSYAEKLGITNAFVQDISSSQQIYIPDFNNCGI